MLPPSLKPQFLDAVRRLMRPIVRQLIAHGISYSAFNRLIKEVYLDVAESDFALPYKRQTDSRLALITGMYRKEVSQLRRKRRTDQTPEEVEDTIVTHLIGRWLSDPAYAAPNGEARPLPYEAADPRTPSFHRLVGDLGIDIPVRSVLDELLRTGTVELQSNGDVVLKQEANIPTPGTEGKLTLLGSDPGELFTTMMHNIESPDQPRMQRKVVYDNIGAEALDALRREARTVGEQFVRRANTLLASYDRDRNPQAPGGKRSRVVLGSYYFEEDVPSRETPAQEEKKPHPPGRIRRKT